MSGRYPPLTCRQFKRALKSLGFSPRPRKGTSHEQWVRSDPFRKVTVDCPKAPFDDWLLNTMIKQAGVSKKEFYRHVR